MEENQFWIAVWRATAAVIAVIVMTIGGCNVHQQRAVVQMVKNGADPLRASCALGLVERAETRCATLAIK